MQTASTGLTNLYNQATTINALPSVVCEWDHNRFAKNITVSHSGTEYQTEGTTFTFSDAQPVVRNFVPYPVGSIIQPNRPYSGLPKGRVGSAKAAGAGSTVRYRTLGERAQYLYWKSSSKSTAGGAITGADVSVVYGDQRSTNKISVTFEKTTAYPVAFSIQTTTNGGTSWTTVSVSPSIGANGVVNLYFNGTTWSQTYNTGFSTNINGVKVATTTMNQAGAYLEIIEVSARLIKDLSTDVKDLSIEKSMQAYDVAAPFGTNSANECSVALDNTAGKYDINNTSGPYYGLLDTNAKITVGYNIDASLYGGSNKEFVPQGVFYVNSWAPDTENAIVSISSSDFAKFLQTQPMPERLFDSYSVTDIVNDILRSVGFNNSIIDSANAESDFVIPYVWYSNEDNVWSALSELCQTTQSAIFLDEQGRLVYLSRNALYAQTNPQYNLSAINNGSTLANLATLSEEFVVQANKIVLTYTPAHANQLVRRTDKQQAQEADAAYFETYISQVYPTEYDLTNSKPIQSVLWQPSSEVVVLQSTYLKQSMTSTATVAYIDPEKAVSWPWKGQMNIEGEVMSWASKEYKWYKNGTAQYSDVSDLAGQQLYDSQSDRWSIKQNRYTGKLSGLVRGLRDTKAASHSVDINSWNLYHKSGSQAVTSGASYVRQDASTMILSSPDQNSYENYLYAIRGAYSDSYPVIGTRMRFARVNGKAYTAGLCFNMQSDNKQGYYVELNTTHMAVDVLGGRVGEFRVYKMNPDGSRLALGTNVDKGAQYGIDMAIEQGNFWFDIDVSHDKNSNSYDVYLNGRKSISFQDSSYPSGRWGVWARGNTSAVFEHFYTNNPSTTPDVQKSSARDRYNGGYYSGYAAVEVMRDGKGQVQWFMDDFGPICHEIREFEVRFDKFPANLSLPYITNHWRAELLGSTMTPFGGKFSVINTSRDIAIIKGADTGIHLNESISQTTFVYGQLVISDNERSLVIEDKVAMRRNGEVSYELSNRWVQTESQAREVGQFMVDHLGEPCDVVSVTGFFSPVLQVGDLVSINWPDRYFLAATHKYHILNISTGFSEGISTTLSLRRAR